MSDDYNTSPVQAVSDETARRIDELQARVRYYPPTELAVAAHEAIRRATVVYGEALLANCPVSIELDHALVMLTDDVMAAANAAIARNHGGLSTTPLGRRRADDAAALRSMNHEAPPT
jgi:hypothetical protein